MKSPKINPRQVARKRSDTLQKARAFPDLVTAAAHLGVPLSTLQRWRQTEEAGGFEALLPRHTDSGRNLHFTLTPDEIHALRHWRLKMDSLPMAIRRFMEDPACRPETSDLLRGIEDRAARLSRLPSYPLSLRRVAHVTAEQRALFRGSKHFQEVEFMQRRDLSITESDGTRHLLNPLDLYESDDMSLNTPFRHQDPATGAWDVGRQSLWTLAVAPCAWLGMDCIGRERDAYRMEDIADHMLQIVLAWGLPRVWRLERGIWDNDFVHGVKLLSVPGHAEERWGGLEALFQVDHVFSSRGKGTIETSFNFIQRLGDHQALNIGRKRGEFEHATKLLLRAHRGDPAALGEFWDVRACADAWRATAQEFNLTPKQRRALGREVAVPADLLAGAIKRPCAASELWRFLPIKGLGTVRHGCLEMRVPHYALPFRFQVNGVSDAYLEHGYQVLYAFHPGRPAEGCHLFNAESGARNRDGLAFGAPILRAPLAEDAPQVRLDRHDQAEMAGLSPKRKANAAVRGEFRAIVGHGQKSRAVSTQRDGLGNSAEVAREGTEELTRSREEREDHLRPSATSADHPRPLVARGELSRDRGVSPVKREACPVSRSSDPAYMDRLEKQFRRDNPGILMSDP